MNGPNFTRNGIIIPMLLVKAIFFTSYSSEGISFSSRSMTVRALAKVLILTTQLVYMLNEWQQFKDSTLLNGILGQSKKTTDIFMFLFQRLKMDLRP